MRLILRRRAPGITTAKKTRWLALGMLVVQFSHISLLYAAEQTRDNTTTSPAQVAAQSKAKADDNSQPLPIDNVHAELTHIITSSDYAELQEQKKWQSFKVEKSAESNLSLLPLLIKIVLVGALIAFIAWIINHAAINGWLQTLRRSFNKRAAVAKFQPSVLAQSWERLPPHHLIPQTVQDLIAKNEIERAASVLYCGSLRWLTQAHGIAIVPATTEKQCLAQVQRIAKIAPLADVKQDINYGVNQSAQQLSISSQNHQSHATKPFMTNENQETAAVLSELSAQYITSVVYLWLQVAYGLPHSPSLAKTSVLNVSISDLAQHWLDRLPLQALLANKSSASHGSATQSNAHSGLNSRVTTAQGESR